MHRPVASNQPSWVARRSAAVPTGDGPINNLPLAHTSARKNQSLHPSPLASSRHVPDTPRMTAAATIPTTPRDTQPDTAALTREHARQVFDDALPLVVQK